MGALGCTVGRTGKFHPRHAVPVDWQRPDVGYEILHSRPSRKIVYLHMEVCTVEWELWE